MTCKLISTDLKLEWLHFRRFGTRLRVASRLFLSFCLSRSGHSTHNKGPVHNNCIVL